MTQIYDIIHFDKHMFLVDKESVARDCMWYFSPRYKKVIKFYSEKEIEDMKNDGDNFKERAEGCYPIVGTTNKELGISTLPDINHRSIPVLATELALKRYPVKDESGNMVMVSQALRRQAFMEGYQEAGARQYTKMNMIDAMEFAFRLADQEIAKRTANAHMYRTANIRDYIDCLMPIRIKIRRAEVALQSCTPGGYFSGMISDYKPQVTGTNEIILKRWLYD